MSLRTWHLENLVVVAALATVAGWTGLPLTEKTMGWALGVMVAHSAHSHGMRKLERSGQHIDWLAEALVALGSVAVLLGADAPARVLVTVPLVRQLLFAAWRFSYRKWGKSLPGGWGRDDD